MGIIVPDFNGKECKKGCNCIDIAEAKNCYMPVKQYRCLNPAGDKLLEKIGEPANKTLQDRAWDLIALNGAYPLPDVMQLLVRATEKLLIDKGYDGHDYEEMEQAVRAAKEKAIPAITELHKTLLKSQGKL